MNTQQEIINFLITNRSHFEQHYHVSKMGLFGSFARGEQTHASDIDILIELEKGTENIYELKKELSNFLSQSFGRPVDIAREKYLKPYVRDAILHDTVYAYE